MTSGLAAAGCGGDLDDLTRSRDGSCGKAGCEGRDPALRRERRRSVVGRGSASSSSNISISWSCVAGTCTSAWSSSATSGTSSATGLALSRNAGGEDGTSTSSSPAPNISRAFRFLAPDEFSASTLKPPCGLEPSRSLNTESSTSESPISDSVVRCSCWPRCCCCTSCNRLGCLGLRLNADICRKDGVACPPRGP